MKRRFSGPPDVLEAARELQQRQRVEYGCDDSKVNLDIPEQVLSKETRFRLGIRSCDDYNAQWS